MQLQSIFCSLLYIYRYIYNILLMPHCNWLTFVSKTLFRFCAETFSNVRRIVPQMWAIYLTAHPHPHTHTYQASTHYVKRCTNQESRIVSKMYYCACLVYVCVMCILWPWIKMILLISYEYYYNYCSLCALLWLILWWNNDIFRNKTSHDNALKYRERNFHMYSIKHLLWSLLISLVRWTWWHVDNNFNA